MTTKPAGGETPDGKKTGRRPLWSVFAWRAGVALSALFAGAFYTYHTLSWVTVVAVLVCGLLTGVGLTAYARLRPLLGRFTSGAAVAVLGAIVLGGTAAALPHCPGVLADRRCTVGEVSTWGMNGIALVAMVAVIVGMPLALWVGGRGIVRLVGRGRAFLRRQLPGRVGAARKTGKKQSRKPAGGRDAGHQVPISKKRLGDSTRTRFPR